MELAHVIGTVVSSLKDDRLTGHKLLLVRGVDPDGTVRDGPALVAVDTVGAGVGELVIVTRGTPASWAVGVEGAPVDAAIVGIVDTVNQGAQRTGGEH